VAAADVARGRRRYVSGLKVRAHERMLYEGVGDGASRPITMRPDRLPCVRVAARMDRADEARQVTSEPVDASEPEHLPLVFELSHSNCTAIITNTPHNTDEACAIVRNLIALVEAQQVDFVAALFRAIWGAEPGRLPYLNRPSFYGEILCCWRPRWIPGTKKSPMHAYAWYVWRKEPRSGPSLKVRVGRRETIASPAT
jgi:hypothetical protein